MNATATLIETMIASGASRTDAGRAARVFISVGLVALDPCNGSIVAKTGAIYERENIEHAAGIWNAAQHGESL